MGSDRPELKSMDFQLGGIVLEGVREYMEKYPVELRASENGRLAVVAKNEGGNNQTWVDLCDLIDWLRVGPPDKRTVDGFVM